MEELLGFAHRLGPLVLDVARQEIPEQILLVLVSDQKIATIHKRFMGIPGPTDVITFQHGEIIVSVETAARQAAAGYQTSFEQELRLYVAHGLLHLAGFEDHSAKGFREMSRVQAALVDRVGRQERSAMPNAPLNEEGVRSQNSGARRSWVR
jgi:rRNA maturation RNase YbeY